MTDKEKRELKDGVISIFKNFNILDHTATIGGLRNDILRFIDSLQEEPTVPVVKTADGDLWNDNMVDAAESLGITQEEYDKIVDECIFGKEPEMADIDDLPKEEPVSEKKCMFTKDIYTDDDRKVLCEDCEEKCEEE